MRLYFVLVLVLGPPVLVLHLLVLVLALALAPLVLVLVLDDILVVLATRLVNWIFCKKMKISQMSSLIHDS